MQLHRWARRRAMPFPKQSGWAQVSLAARGPILKDDHSAVARCHLQAPVGSPRGRLPSAVREPCKLKTRAPLRLCVAGRQNAVGACRPSTFLVAASASWQLQNRCIWRRGGSLVPHLLAHRLCRSRAGRMTKCDAPFTSVPPCERLRGQEPVRSAGGRLRGDGRGARSASAHSGGERGGTRS